MNHRGLDGKGFALNFVHQDIIFYTYIGYLLKLEFTGRANWVECKDIDNR